MIGQTFKKAIQSAAIVLTLCVATPPSATAAPLYFYPAETWTITQTDLTCRVRNQFNNGFILTLEDKKAAAQNFLANMSLNFRQPAFTAGQVYNASIGVAEGKTQMVQVKAVNPETLSLPLGNYPGLMETVLYAPTLNFIIEGNDFNFSLVGLAQQTPNFKACTGAAMMDGAAQIPTDMHAHMNAAPAPAMSAMHERPETQVIPTDLYDQISAQTGMQAKPSKEAEMSAAMKSEDTPTDLISPPKKKPSAAKGDSPFSDMFTDNEPLYDDEDTAAIKTMPILNDSDWNLEKATLRYQEAERQLKAMGQKLQKERAQCKMEKKELEALLFDPQLTSEQQLAKLSSLEEELKRTKVEMRNQELQYKERIKILENQLNSF